MAELRFVLDERAFDLAATSDDEAAAALAGLTRLLIRLRGDREQVGLGTGWGSLPCRPGHDVASVLAAEVLPGLPRDDRMLLLGVLDKCVAWDDGIDWVEPSSSVSQRPWESFGVGFAHRRVGARRGIAVITTVTCGHRCAVMVDVLGVSRLVQFAATPDDLPAFYRSLFELEDITEQGFFTLAERAFPRLRFAAGLTFRRFNGSYHDLRRGVVEHLAALDDYWAAAYVEERGDSERIGSRLPIALSREGNRTRASEQLMKLRDVRHEGAAYRCEWHTKLEPHRNRIHFHPGDGRTGDCVLIGIFVDHLDT